MAEASQVKRIASPEDMYNMMKGIFQLIKNNALKEIKQIFERFNMKQYTYIINYQICGCLPLYLAIECNHVELSRYLFKFSIHQGRREMARRWKRCRHPLMAAVQVHNLTLIKLILENLFDINDPVNGSDTPLMVAIVLGDLTAVKLIVQMGGDVNRSCFRGRTPLTESIFYIEIFKFLLSRGADVNHQDDECFTALHLAISNHKKECFFQLLNAGADVTIRNNEGINPLILAALNLNLKVVKCLMLRADYTYLNKLEAMEIMNACYVCGQQTTIVAWIETIRARKQANLPKKYDKLPEEFLDFFQEFTTEEELLDLQDNVLYLAYQGILVLDRIVGRQNKHYLQVLLQTALIAKKLNNRDKVRQFIDHIQEYCQDTSNYFVAANKRAFKTFFCEITKDKPPLDFFSSGGFDIFKIIAETLQTMWLHFKGNSAPNQFLVDGKYSQLVDTFLYMISIIKFREFPQEELNQFKEILIKLIRLDIRVKMQESLLHCAVNLMRIQSITVEVICILLESGANATSENCYGQTPGMYALTKLPDPTRYVVLGLLTVYK